MRPSYRSFASAAVYRESLPGPQQELLAQFAQQALKPTEAPCRFHAHTHLPATKPAIELCSFFGVHQAMVSYHRYRVNGSPLKPDLETRSIGIDAGQRSACHLACRA